MLAGILLLEVNPAPARRVGTPEAPLPVSNSTDEAAIRALFQQKIDGWNHRSAADFAAVFADDADLVTFGTHLKGRPEIASFHRRLFSAPLNGSRLEGQIKGIRFLSSEVAVMHAHGRMMPSQAETSQDPGSIETLVFTRTDGKWHIATLQDSRPALELQTVLMSGHRLSHAQH